MIYLDFEDSDGVSSAAVLSTITDNLSLPNEQVHAIYSQLNEGQQHLLNFMVQCPLRCKFAENDYELPPKPFRLFLIGGASDGKSFLIKAITEYLKQVLRYPNQNLDQPSVLVTAKAAKGISSIALHIVHFHSLLSLD